MQDEAPLGGRASSLTSGAPTSLSASHPLPSADFSLEVHFAVLRRFMSVSRNGADPIAPEAAEDQGVPAQAAQQNAAFLSYLGLLIEEKPGRFKPTPVAMQLINTQLQDEQRGRRLLRSIIGKTWFGTAAQTLLRTEQGKPVRQNDLVAALETSAHLSAGAYDRALLVLVQYLVYTGLVVFPEPAQAPKPDSATFAPVAARSDSSPAHVTKASAPARPRRKPPGPDSVGTGEWEVIETNEFSLKIRPSAAALRRLRQQLDLLDQQLAERQ